MNNCGFSIRTLVNSRPLKKSDFRYTLPNCLCLSLRLYRWSIIVCTCNLKAQGPRLCNPIPDQLLQQSELKPCFVCLKYLLMVWETWQPPPPHLEILAALFIEGPGHRLGIFSTWARVSDTNTPVLPSISCSYVKGLKSQTGQFMELNFVCTNLQWSD